MSGQTLALADAVLKDDYEGPTRDQMNNQCKLTAQVLKNTTDFVGRQAVLTMHVKRNTGLGARLEGEVLPQAGAQGYVKQLIPCRSLYGRIRLTAQVINRMASEQGSFINAVNSEMDGIKTDAARDYNREAWGTSDGVVAKCGTSTATNVIQLDAATPEQVMFQFAEGGLRVDLGTTSTPQSVAANRGIVGFDLVAKTITIDGAAVTTSSATFVFRQGNGGTGANQREITGMQSIIDNTLPLFGIDPATVWQWASIVDANSGTLRPISEALVAKLIMRANNRSGRDVDLLWCEDGVYRAFGNLLSGMKRIVNTQQLQGGYTGLAFDAAGNTATITRDKDAPPNKLYGMDSQQFVEFVADDWQFDRTDGNTLRFATDGTHSFEAIWYSFRELATLRRNSHFRIDDLEAA